MKKIAIIMLVVLICCAALSFTACGDKLKANEIRITVNGKDFIAEIADTKAAKEFRNLLPITLNMHSVNDRELYEDIPNVSFTQQIDSDATFEGDIVLRGDNRLTIFYAFANTDNWTKIGKIKNDDINVFVNAVTQAVNNSSSKTVKVTISK